jgi:hypothetical protein
VAVKRGELMRLTCQPDPLSRNNTFMAVLDGRVARRDEDATTPAPSAQQQSRSTGMLSHGLIGWSQPGQCDGG